ncbi:MAG: universal stress protein [Candidatus Melainabacteria bacterium]|nr:universal stress protein [Candidatus Melainabacteria bacterium]
MKVILAVDDSIYSQEVINAVINREWPLDTEFKVLTVLEPLDCCLDNKYEDLLLGIDEKRKKAVQHLGKSVREKLEATMHGARVHFEVRSGNPKAEVIDAAVEWCADRIMIGAHGHRGCPHNLIGSVSRAVAGNAPCSVEIVRSKKLDKKALKLREASTVPAEV